MLPVNGKPLLRRLVDRCKKQNIDEVIVVAGYRPDKIDVNGIELVTNERYETTGELTSLACAIDRFSDDMVIMYGDLIFRSYVLRGLLESDRGLTVVVDSQYESTETTKSPDFAYCSAPDDRSLWGQDVLLKQLRQSPSVDNVAANGRWIGMARSNTDGRKWLTDGLQHLSKLENFDQLNMGDLLNHIVEQGKSVRGIYIHGHWIDVNSLTDLERANAFTTRHR